MMKTPRLLLIGGSAGSLEVILGLLPGIKITPDLAIIIVLHRKSGDDMLLIDVLSFRTQLKVKEAEEKEKIRGGMIYVAPADYHLLIEQDLSFSLDFSEKVNYSRPCIDVTFQTAADTPGKKPACLLLSGANEDGTAGAVAIKAAGGIVAIQQPGSAEVGYMPWNALNHIQPDYLLNPEEMTDFINSLGA